MIKIENLLSAIRLFISFAFLGIGVGVFFSFHLFFTAFIVPLIAVLQSSWQEESGFATLFFLTFSIFGLIALIITFIFYLLILTIYYRLLRLFWSSPPKIFCSPKGFKNRSYHFLIGSIANIPIVLVFNIYLFFASGFSLKRYIKNLMFEPLYKSYGYNPDYYSFSEKFSDKSDNISMIELLNDKFLGYELMMFFIFSYLLYVLSDKYLTKAKTTEIEKIDC